MNKSELDPSASPEAEFGAFLRGEREARGWRQGDLATMIGCSPTHISHLETGHRRPTAPVARKLDKAFGLDRVFSNKAHAVQSSTLLEGFPAYVAMESKARELRLFTLGIVPSVLQTTDYARAIAVAAAERGSITEDQAAERVRYLERRKAKLHGEPSQVIHVVMDESCVRRPVGGPAVMAAQFDHLLAFARLPHTVLQVAPYRIGEARAFDLPVNIITLADRSLMSYAESAQQGNLERDSDAVQPMLSSYYQLQARSLSQDESVALISQLREELP
ncbi:Scr1 family TA system antitoxin-like transcriptional regulator [Kitasatospora sp. NPDC059722]|uniref:helix-turn-helix domain-containing protein n=1 Tax=Kitasatospora sp. NPDC059722 TaxID=3346925 RepID=UPI00368B7412